MLQVTPQHGEDSRERQVEDHLFVLTRGGISRQHPLRSWVVAAFDHEEALQSIENSAESPTPMPQSSNSAVFQFLPAHESNCVLVSEESLKLERVSIRVHQLSQDASGGFAAS